MCELKMYTAVQVCLQELDRLSLPQSTGAWLVGVEFNAPLDTIGL